MTSIPLFRSDNTAGVSPQVLEALAVANRGLAAAYGQDDLSSALNDAMSEVFERRCWCFPVSSGTAANALALSAISATETVIACHSEAHILRNEDSATQFFTPGVRLEPLGGDDGRISADLLAAFARASASAESTWSALSLTQLTEAGTVYLPDEIASLAETAHACGAKVHLDGARFANAVVSLDCRPADMSWRMGVDILSFGATKNGAMNADAVITFDAILAAKVESRLKKSGQLTSKMRFMAAQLIAMLQEDLWLENAAHANAMAQRLHELLSGVSGVEIVHAVEGNHLFISLDAQQLSKLRDAATELWQVRTDKNGNPVFRIVTSFSTGADEIDRFINLLAT